MNLSGKTIFITGGSRGIGAATVKKLASYGAKIAFTYSSQQAAAETLLKELPNEGHKAYQLDISNAEQVETVLPQVVSDMGGLIHGVVNNAGITKDQLILRMKNEDFQQVIQTNLNGTFYVSRFFAKHMLKNRQGSIVNMSSVVGAMGNPGQANYCASKSGVEGMTRSLALELASRSIRVNAIAPGYISSDMTKALTEEQLKAFSDNIPFGRAGEPEEIAETVAFLVSDSSSYITGQVIHVNGGLYL